MSHKLRLGDIIMIFRKRVMFSIFCIFGVPIWQIQNIKFINFRFNTYKKYHNLLLYHEIPQILVYFSNHIHSNMKISVHIN